MNEDNDEIYKITLDMDKIFDNYRFRKPDDKSNINQLFKYIFSYN